MVFDGVLFLVGEALTLGAVGLGAAPGFAAVSERTAGAVFP
ncbi:MAG TPA: hypothetical protein VGI90_00150 [Steroidobacteraceae bacterium]